MTNVTHMTLDERARMQARLIEIDREIDSATRWGAALTVLDEERRGIRHMLDLMKEGKRK